jgi:hypothetical protein
MDSLWRLAMWGLSAAAALTLAVLSSYSDAGSARLMTALQGFGNSDRADQAQSASRPEVPPIAETVRALAAERERLAARIDRIEQTLEGLTGSIRRQSGRGTVVPPVSAGPAARGLEEETQPAAPDRMVSPTTPTGDRKPNLRPQVSVNAASVPIDPSAVVEQGKAEFGIDIGGAPNFEALRVLWTSAKASNSGLLDSLYPVVGLRETGKTKGAELRLIIGPLADIEAATRLCAALTPAQRTCQPVGFEGQRLTEADKPPERKTAPPKPASRPTTPTRLFGLF